jgi:hypothetical protein
VQQAREALSFGSLQTGNVNPTCKRRSVARVCASLLVCVVPLNKLYVDTFFRIRPWYCVVLFYVVWSVLKGTFCLSRVRILSVALICISASLTILVPSGYIEPVRVISAFGDLILGILAVQLIVDASRSGWDGWKLWRTASISCAAYGLAQFILFTLYRVSLDDYTFAIFTRTGRHGVDQYARFVRPTGTFEDSNNFAIYLVTSFWLVWLCPSRSKRKFLQGSLDLLVPGIVFLSLSRSAISGLIASTVVSVFWRKTRRPSSGRRNRMALKFSFIIIIGITAMYWNTLVYILDLRTQRSSGTNQHLELPVLGLSVGLGNLRGAGLGNFGTYYFNRFHPPEGAAWSTFNSFTQLVAENGFILGVFQISLFYLRDAWLCFKTARAGVGMARACILSVVALFVSSLSYLGLGNGYAWVFMGFVSSLDRVKVKSVE